MSKIDMLGTEIIIINFEEKDYICLEDIVRNIENGPCAYRKMAPEQKHY